MITAERKPIEELVASVKPFERLLLVGCNACVTVCSAGGRKEVGVLASALRMTALKSGRPLEVKEWTVERQCDPEYVEELVPHAAGMDAIMSMACGCGVQELARRFKGKPVLPAVNTKFMGASERQGVWAERCQGCGDCLLGITGGVCPVARCSKRLFNGPCGGSTNGKCANQPRGGLRLAADLGPPQGPGMEDRYEELCPPKTGAPVGAADPARSSGRIWQNENRTVFWKKCWRPVIWQSPRSAVPPGGRFPAKSRTRPNCSGGYVDAVNVTDNQTAMVRMSSFAASVFIRQMGLQPVLQMVSRDRNRLAMQADILGLMPTASTPCCACPGTIPTSVTTPMAA
jgi:ferredoxin